MCGITGWFSQTPNTADAEPRLQAMVKALQHRGPDGCGHQLDAHSALGHSRLATIDLNHGQQPMRSHDDAYSISFNGEIYNYPQLRHQLMQQGHQFNSHSDTEVILELYRAHGWQGFNQLRGMFAFALWDHAQNRGYLVRDPLGIKPLFIDNSDPEQLLFGSEAKAILQYRETKPELATDSLHLLLNFRYLPAERSLFKNIHQLAPGAVLEWQLKSDNKQYQLSPPSSENGDLLQALQSSVQHHFTADVEVGAYLSGGIDSAIITALGKRISPRPLRTFTLKAGDDPNEATNAARTAEILGLENIQGSIDSGDMQYTLSKLVWHLETPKINALQISQLAQMTSQHVKVALSGLGGDELFYGYNAHRIMHQAHNLHRYLPKIIGSSLGGIGATTLAALERPLWSEAERGLRMLQQLGDWPRVYGLMRNLWDSPTLRQKIYGPRMLDAKLPDAFETLEQLWPDNRDPVDAMAQFEWKNKMVNDLLWQEDRCSMAAGLEVRTPFVDALFASQAQGLRRETLMPNGQPKGYMKQQLASILPAEIIHRPKSGFQVSAADFYHQHLAPLATNLLSETTIRQHGLFNPEFVQHVLKQGPSQKLRWHYFMLYFMLMTHLWLDVFEQQKWTHK